MMFGGSFPREPRTMFQELMREPDRLPGFMREMMAQYQAEQARRRQKK